MKPLHDQHDALPNPMPDVTNVWNPANFEPDRFLPATLHKYSDHARYLLHRICYSQIFHQRSKKPVPLMAKLLRTFIPKMVYPDLRDALIASKAMTCDHIYQTGSKSFHFDLGPALSMRKFERVAITNKKLVRKILANRRSEDRKITEDVYRHLRTNLFKLQIDAEAALASIRRTRTMRRACLSASIEAIRDSDLWFKVCPFGRVHTNVTNLQSSLRRFLRVDNNKLVNLDIRNAQPLFLGILALNYHLSASCLTPFNEFSVGNRDIADQMLQFMSVRMPKANNGEENTSTSSQETKTNCTPSHYDVQNQEGGRNSTNKENIINTKPTTSHDDVHFWASYQKENTIQLLAMGAPEDVARYLDLCQTGQFYEFLMSQAKVSVDKRAVFKKRLFQSLFFGKDKKTTEANLFAQYFPNVYTVIRKIKKKDYRQMAHTLQRLESQFMIRRVARRIMEEHSNLFIATIHDSIVTTEANADEVLGVMREEFAKVGLDPAINKEVLE